MTFDLRSLIDAKKRARGAQDQEQEPESKHKGRSGDRSSIYHSQRMYGGGTRELVPVKRRKKQAPQQEVWDRLGEPSGKFDYYDASDSAPSESRKV